jgi:peptidoglycan/LPS O-acetylase OafA/YrhL
MSDIESALSLFLRRLTGVIFLPAEVQALTFVTAFFCQSNQTARILGCCVVDWLAEKGGGKSYGLYLLRMPVLCAASSNRLGNYGAWRILSRVCLAPILGRNGRSGQIAL